MKSYLKFLRKLPKKLRERLEKAIGKIESNDLRDLDIKKMGGYANQYRCRIGKIRIIFIMTDHGNWIMDIDFRGGIYK